MPNKSKLGELGLIVIAFMSLACSMPVFESDYCLDPKPLTAERVLGTWTATYDNHWIRGFDWDGQQYVNGVETLTFLADGTYTHTFENETFQYASEPAAWSLDNEAIDAPKLRLEKMRYFAAGETFDEQHESLSLQPELGDILSTYQPANLYPEEVTYPESGFVYLYLRRCTFSLVLLQMTFIGRDPDNTSPLSPVFYED